MGSDAIWKYLVVVSSSRKSLSLDLSRTVFWMLELEDGHQRFYSWPIDLSSYEHLHRLNLSGNFLTTIPDTVSRLTNLTELDLEQNRLKALPLALGWCTALERNMTLEIGVRSFLFPCAQYDFIMIHGREQDFCFCATRI